MSAVIRRWLVVLVGASLLIGLTAGQLSAAKPTKKTYSVSVAPTSVPFNPAGETVTFTLTYTNTTPGGIASFNSLTLTAPAGFTIDPDTVDVTTSSGNTGFSVVASASAPQITVTNLYPVSYAEWAELTFEATVEPVATTCAGSVGTWVTRAWTGSNTSGDLFELSGTVPRTTVGTFLQPGATIPASGDGGATLTNVGTTCAPVTFSRNGNEVTVWKPDDPSLAFLVEVNAWDPEPADAPMTTWTQVDTPAPDHPVKWCNGTWDAADPTDMTDVTLPVFDDSVTPAIDEVSCLLRQETNIAGTDTSGDQLVQVLEWIYLTGDWSGKRL